MAGPVGLLHVEDFAELNSSIRHLLKLGFRNVVVLGLDAMVVSPDLQEHIHRVDYITSGLGATENAVNSLYRHYKIARFIMDTMPNACFFLLRNTHN